VCLTYGRAEPSDQGGQKDEALSRKGVGDDPDAVDLAGEVACRVRADDRPLGGRQLARQRRGGSGCSAKLGAGRFTGEGSWERLPLRDPVPQRNRLLH